MPGTRSSLVVLVVLLSALGLVSRAGAEPPGAAPPSEVRTLNVFAAASLAGAFEAVGRSFETSHPGVELQFNFAGSPTLAQQIQQGAPADVFASADEINMQKLVEAGAVAGAPKRFAANRLQIVVARNNPKQIATLADLGKPGLVIALCGPTVPCGRYAAEAFAKAGVAVPAASQEVDVKAVLTKVRLGEADAGVVYVTDVRAAGDQVQGVDIPATVNVVAHYPLAVLKDAPQAVPAAAFVEFVLSPAGQRHLESLGFSPP